VVKQKTKLLVTGAAVVALLFVLLILDTPVAHAVSFSLDDNPLLAQWYGGEVGTGAEDPFGLYSSPGLAPSPSLAGIPAFDGDILSPGPVLQLPSPNGFYVDSLSNNTVDTGLPIWLLFSVDRVSSGAAGTAVAGQAGLNQQPADIYTSTDLYVAPGAFAGTLGPGPFAGILPAPLGGPASNILTIDDSALGLVSGGPIGQGTHDNVDGFDLQVLDEDGDGFHDGWDYFTIYPDEAVAMNDIFGVIPPVSAADIFDVLPGAPGTVPIPFATAPSMGLDFFGLNTDSIDALIMFDNDVQGGPAWSRPGDPPRPGGQAEIDYALFSLAPGSLSLAEFGLDAADVFFTDFSGAFALYAPSGSLGLAGVPGGEPLWGDNIDALELQPVPEPASLLLLGFGLAGLVGSRWKRRTKK